MDNPKNNGKVTQLGTIRDDDVNGETRSAPGDLAKPSSSKESLTFTPFVGNVKECSPLAERSLAIPNTYVQNDGLTTSLSTRAKGHYRNVNNGFASGPPWPTSPRREKPWSTVGGWQKKQQMQAIEKEINVMATETLVGIRKWRPKWMQRFNTKSWMLLWMCWYCTVQGLIVNGLVPSAITSIERRFQLSTSTIGRIMQFYDFGYVLLCIPVSYFGGRHSKPMVLACGLLLMATGSFIFMMPHNISESYTSTYNADDVGFSKCLPNRGLSNIYSAMLHNRSTVHISGASAEALKSCPSPENQPGTFRYVFLFCLAHFLHGIGATPLFTIGVSYIDENVGPALSSLYLGVFYSFGIFGPAIGFIMSSSFLQYHTDFLQAEHQHSIVNLNEGDPKWVGAWWIGFQIASFLALLAIFPIMSLPKVLPESLKWHRTRLHEETVLGIKKRSPECCGIPSSSRTAASCGPLLPTDGDEKPSTTPVTICESMPAILNSQGPIWYHIWLDVRHIPIAIYRILTNGSYMLITLSMAVDGLIITGASTFMSKYLERQFSVPPSKANMLIGCIMVPMAGIGTMFSGFVVQRFRLSCVKTLKFCIALLMCSLLLSPMYLIYCDHVHLAGIETLYREDAKKDVAYPNNTELLPNLNSKCNSHCDCVKSEYHPVCAEYSNENQISFYSPCFAGCVDRYEPLRKVYYNCSCVPGNTKAGFKAVKNGFCESKCKGLFGFLTLFGPFCFFAFAVGVPLISVILRTVDYAERSFALGIQWILVRVIGTIPAPVLFGWMFDVSCIEKHQDHCSGEEGSCMLYKNSLLADLFLAFSVVGQTIGMVLLIVTLLFFSTQMRDDPLPVTAVDAHDEADVSLDEVEADVDKPTDPANTDVNCEYYCCWDDRTAEKERLKTVNGSDFLRL